MLRSKARHKCFLCVLPAGSSTRSSFSFLLDSSPQFWSVLDPSMLVVFTVQETPHLITHNLQSGLLNPVNLWMAVLSLGSNHPEFLLARLPVPVLLCGSKMYSSVPSWLLSVSSWLVCPILSSPVCDLQAQKTGMIPAGFSFPPRRTSWLCTSPIWASPFSTCLTSWQQVPRNPGNPGFRLASKEMDWFPILRSRQKSISLAIKCHRSVSWVTLRSIFGFATVTASSVWLWA